MCTLQNSKLSKEFKMVPKLLSPDITAKHFKD